jgi:transposase
VEAPDLGNEDGVMPKEQSPGTPTTRRYSPEEKAAAVPRRYPSSAMSE